MWLRPAGTGVRGLLAGERVKGPFPSPYLQRPRVQNQNGGKLGWVEGGSIPFQELELQRACQPGREEHFGLGAGCGGLQRWRWLCPGGGSRPLLTLYPPKC